LKRKRNSSIGNRIFVHHTIVSAIKRLEAVSDRVSYIVMRDRWCNTIALNVQATNEKKSDDSTDGLSEEFEQVFNHF
jgi:hypothetical protein